MTEPGSGEGIQELFERIGRREQAALTELYDRTGKLLFGLAQKILGDPEAAGEVLLDTYTHVWKSPAARDVNLQPLDLLLKITRAYAIARWGESHRTRHHAPPSVTATRTVAPAAQKVARFQLESLAPMQREILDWAYFSGMGVDEIAARIGTPGGAVKAHVRMGLNRLCRTIELHESQESHASIDEPDGEEGAMR